MLFGILQRELARRRPMQESLSPQEKAFRLAALGLLALGLLLQFWLWFQGAPHSLLSDGPDGLILNSPEPNDPDSRWLGDQIGLLEPAIEFANNGTVPQSAKRSSGGGMTPGALLPMLIGTSLRIIPDYRSATFILILADGLAAIAITQVMVLAGGWRFALIFLAVFWISPWRLFHSGFLWDPSFIVLPACAHLWTSWRLRESDRFGSSFILGVVLASSVQLHLSSFVLWIITAALYTVRLIRIRISGFFLGMILGGLTLLPLLWEVSQGQPLDLPKPDESAEIHWLKAPLRMFRAGIYWLRLGGGDLGRRTTESLPDLSGVEWLQGVVFVASALTAFVALAANATVIRRTVRCQTAPGKKFLLRYAEIMLFSTLLATAFSPVTPQGWDLLIALVAACIPVALWIDHARIKESLGMRTTLIAFFLIRFSIILLVGLGHPFYNLG